MAAKKIAYNQEARESIRKGVNQLSRAVKVTLGPRGRNVIIEKSFGAPTVTDVQVGGGSVAYVDNTVGNDISVDLSVLVTTSSRITVLFDADAPGIQDLIGVDFLSTVDDSGTAPETNKNTNLAITLQNPPPTGDGAQNRSPKDAKKSPRCKKHSQTF